METKTAIALLQEIRKCTLCEKHLPLQPKPVCSFSEESRILIVGQAPGIKVHNSGIPWDDASGNFVINNNDGPGSVELVLQPNGNLLIEGSCIQFDTVACTAAPGSFTCVAGTCP